MIEIALLFIVLALCVLGVLCGFLYRAVRRLSLIAACHQLATAAILKDEIDVAVRSLDHANEYFEGKT